MHAVLAGISRLTTRCARRCMLGERILKLNGTSMLSMVAIDSPVDKFDLTLVFILIRLTVTVVYIRIVVAVDLVWHWRGHCASHGFATGERDDPGPSQCIHLRGGAPGGLRWCTITWCTYTTAMHACMVLLHNWVAAAAPMCDLAGHPLGRFWGSSTRRPASVQRTTASTRDWGI